MSDPTAFVLWEEIVAIFIDGKSDRILSWAWNFNFFFIFSKQFASKAETSFAESWFKDISTRSRVFISDGFHERTSDKHFISSLSKSKTFFGIFGKIIFKQIGVGRWRTWGLFSEIILMAESKSCSSIGADWVRVIELVTTKLDDNYSIFFLSEKRGLLENEKSILEAEVLVGEWHI